MKGQLRKVRVEKLIKFKASEGEDLLKRELDQVEGKVIIRCFRLVAKWAKSFLEAEAVVEAGLSPQFGVHGPGTS